MKLTIAALLAAVILAGCYSDAPSHAYIGDLPRSHRAAIVASDSGCDGAGASEHRDPASHCYIDRRKTKD